MAKREWTRISETPTQDFFEGVEQQMGQKESEKPEIILICSIDQLTTKVEAYSDKLKQETEIDILEAEIKNRLKYIQVNSIELPCRKEKTIEEYKDEIANYIKDVCSDGLKGLKATSDITHIIELTDNKPFNERFRAVPHSKRPEFKKLLEDLLENDIIVESKSEYCSPPHVIMKADGSIRFTVDYKKLNSKTVKDNYPLPIIDDLLRELAQATYFSKMDLEQGYYCIKMDPKSRKFTAFLCEYGLFEWTRLPMGLKNSGATFSRAMNKLFKEHIGKFLYIYMDDFVIYSRTPAEHAEHLKIVIDILKKAEMKIKLKKCAFFEHEIEFLGHIIKGGFIKRSPKKIEALFRYREPITLRQLLGFLGLAGHYRKFIEHFAEVAHSLYECANTNRGNSRRLKQFTEECRKAFNTLRECLTDETKV